ncbi:hypothetical protein BS78_K096800 [Paspalum vaginatum]|uniref:Ubiquitin carboxyl-terminal hydrolase n=1 Tax=Paspalum vaginatum TaxID=158149 RepID=A0A9W7XDU6_9POAL|nr:hypothetical protein BS78_K096800 [Paspalum vaginatum]KAJ1257329.1 hypothetical protein BS78_K096800 [Paspalum vaginatum]KAJ1257330.1 hypothetical protein BS78_K096800 [Paspalum vaginatum]
MTIPSAEGFLQASSCLPCTAEEEREVVTALTREAEENVKDEDLRFLVSQSWWMEWQLYVGLVSYEENDSEQLPQATNRPGEIDNSKLVSAETINDSEGPELQRTLREGQDYTLVPQEVWQKLCEWYKGGPEIPRKVILEDPTRKAYIVDVYPLCLKLIDGRDNSERLIRISRKARIQELYSMVCLLLSVEQPEIFIWDYYQKSKGKMLTNFNDTLEEAQLTMDQEILLEMKLDENSSGFSTRSTSNELALIPSAPSTSSLSIAGGPTSSNGFSSGIGSSFSQGNRLRDAEDGYSSFSNGTKDDTHGLSGLHNLGNTCFMNSAIQSLVHTPPLVEYFLEDYSREINTENPLGLQGELAIAFGELLRKLWSSGRTSVAPRVFKSKLSRFAPQFSGYNQHDSQELLAFLLDGLHEDLNRVIKKPYIEAKDADGRPDNEFAEECWKYHKARNDSIIVDKFQGQYKSTLVCPVCNKISVTFDPFMYLSLPLPSTITRMITVTVFSGTGDALPMPYTVTVKKNGNCRDLTKALTDVCCLESSETLLLAEVYERRIYRYLTNPIEGLSHIKDEDILVAYRLPVDHENLFRVEILHQRADRFAVEPQFNIHRKLIGCPLVTCISNFSPGKSDIYGAVSAVLVPFVRTNAHGPDVSTVKLNGNGPSLDGIVLTDNGTTCEQDLSTSDVDDNAADELLPFQLSLTDDKGSTRSAISMDSNRGSGMVLRVLMDWSDKEHGMYKIDYMDQLPEVFRPGFMSKKTRQEAVNLFSCLDAFLKEEPLGPDDMWYCPGCKEHRQASKKLDLWRLPEILVVHLKRFSYSRYMKNKLDTFVNFPIHDLNMSKYVKQMSRGDQHPMYELYAVINHYGGLGGGHYSAYAKLVEEDNWYHFDDSHVSSVNEDEIRTSAAYVLFYQRVGGSRALANGVPFDIEMVDSLET